MKCKYLLIFLLTAGRLFSQVTERDLSREKWQFADADTPAFYPAEVPGTVHTDLFRTKQIPDPFYAANEQKLQWVEKKTWIYRTDFKLSKKELDHKNLELLFEGLDTFAEVQLNGQTILSANNMFRTWRADVRKFLKPENHLQITFFSAPEKGRELAKKLPYTLPEGERVFIRKAQYHFGWDWGPRFVTAGIWKPVRLLLWNDAKIEQVKFSQKISAERADLDFTTQISVAKPGRYQLTVNDKSATFTLKKGANTIQLPFTILKPELWFPNGLGEAHLYPFKISLLKNGRFISEKTLNVGLRTVELIQNKDEKGRSFYFKINGIPIYAKGMNVIPAHSFLPAAEKSIYTKWMDDAKKLHMNMMRIWGGGVYPDDEFYNEADRAGILIWQDFMFAGSMYPHDPGFLDNVKAEVADQVERLQNHPSLAIWCGNNEIDEGWHNWGWQKQLHYTPKDSATIWNGYVKTFREVIPAVLDAASATKPLYVQSSPANGWGRAKSYTEGDVHYWGVWWGMEPFEKYREKTGRFVSEYGFQGMPPISTIKTFTDHLSFDDPGVRNHQKHAIGYQTIKTYMERDYPVPADFENFAYISQLLQARGLTIAVEAHRLQKPYNMGTLYWQLNDVWPVTSWSVADYYGNQKAAYYAAERAFQPVHWIMEETNGVLKFWLNNDTAQKIAGEVRLTVKDFKGRTLLDHPLTCESPAFGNVASLQLPKKELLKFDFRKALIEIDNGVLPVGKAKFYLERPKDLQLEKPLITVRRIDSRTLELKTDVLAKDVYVVAGMNNFSDNFFDLMPGDKKIIHADKPFSDYEIRTLNDIVMSK